MDVHCYPISMVPGTSALLRDFLDPSNVASNGVDRARLRRWFPSEPYGFGWAEKSPQLTSGHRERLAALLLEQA